MSSDVDPDRSEKDEVSEKRGPSMKSSVSTLRSILLLMYPCLRCSTGVRAAP